MVTIPQIKNKTIIEAVDDSEIEGSKQDVSYDWRCCGWLESAMHVIFLFFSLSERQHQVPSVLI